MKPIPDSVTVNTGDQYLVRPTIDNFFMDTAEHLKTNYGLRSGPNPFIIESGAIAYRGLTPSDDRITYLSFFQKIVATVMETRTDFNHVQYTFFRNLDGVEELVKRQNRVYNIADE
ncbi:MAG: hypothetical protein Q7S55_00350 [Nanoarchaeota archaeon]|nr:hypothetical protein [Nanoarchaeota archaeon]